jgi:hypothetical protein
MQKPTRKIRTTEQVLAEQKHQTEALKEARKQHEAAEAAKKEIVPATPPPTAVALPDTRTPVQRYLDDIAPANIVGRLLKFTREGLFITADDDKPVDTDAEFIVLADETLIGWIKFGPRDADPPEPPQRAQGLLFDGFILPPRESLGDMDQAQWPIGLSGMPEDPWQHQNCIVLQRTDTRELFTFATSSVTGRRAVGNLLKHYNRMQKINPNELPVVRLQAGGFNHRDERIGWVHTPQFAVRGRAPRDSAIKPDTSVGADMNDEIPFLS